jgi:hypothetical protein
MKLPFTQASLRRTIAVARKDGTLIVHDGDKPSTTVVPSPLDGNAHRRSDWDDVEA